MKVKAIWKILILLAVILLAVCSVVVCYFDLNGTVEFRDDKTALAETDKDALIITLPKKGELSKMEDILFGCREGEKTEEEKDVPVNVPGEGEAQEPETPDGETGDSGGSGNGLPTWNASGEYSQEVDILVLVNKEYPVDENYVPVDLVQLDYRASNRSSKWQVMTRVAADAFNKLCADALAEGHEIVATTAYRSYNFQSYLYNSYVEKDGQALADTYSAQPGKSEHQTGLATDVSSPSVGYSLTKEYGGTPEGTWLAENCYKYGFILRYQKGKEEITGYMYEPWHIRYVGQEAAKEIWEKGLTLEEYLGKAPDSAAKKASE